MSAVTVVVINCNGKDYLDDCLTSIRDSEEDIYETVVVDDGSTDGSVDHIRSTYPWVTVIMLAKNQGPSYARNTGIRHAQTDLILLLDNDVVVTKGWLSPLIESINSSDSVAVVCSRLLVWEEPDTIDQQGLEAHYIGMPAKKYSRMKVDELKKQDPEAVGGTGGCSILIRKSVLEDSNMFDPDVLYQFEDLDFCLSLRARGYHFIADPRSIVFHKRLTGGTAGLSDNPAEYSPKRAFYLFRNRWIIIIKHYSIITLILTAPALLAFEAASLVIAIRRKVFFPYVRALASVVRDLPLITAKRRQILRTKVVRDGVMLTSCRVTLGLGTVRGSIENAVSILFDAALRIYWSVVSPMLR